MLDLTAAQLVGHSGLLTDPKIPNVKRRAVAELLARCEAAEARAAAAEDRAVRVAAERDAALACIAAVEKQRDDLGRLVVEHIIGRQCALAERDQALARIAAVEKLCRESGSWMRPQFRTDRLVFVVPTGDVRDALAVPGVAEPQNEQEPTE